MRGNKSSPLLTPPHSNHSTAKAVLAAVAFTYAATTLLYNSVGLPSAQHDSHLLRVEESGKASRQEPTRQRVVWSVFSTQCNEFNDWNSVVTVKAHQKLSIQGPIVRLMSCKDPTYTPPGIQYEKYRLVRTPDFDPVDGDVFPPRNKGYSVNYWLNSDIPDLPHDDDVIVLLDPDQLYINHLDVRGVRHGQALAAGYSLSPKFFETARAYCRGACDRIDDPMSILYGAPYVLTAGDLRRLAPVWNELTEVFRRKEVLKDWLSEMYSYIVAALKLGIHHRKESLMISHPEDDNEPWHLVHWNSHIRPPLTFIHFCQEYKLGSLRWGKHMFQHMDLRNCKQSNMFEEPTGNDRIILDALEGTPLDMHSDTITRQELFEARSAFLYNLVVSASNAAFKAYRETNCPWTKKQPKPLPSPLPGTVMPPAASAKSVVQRMPVLWSVMLTQCSPFNDWNSIAVAESHRRLNIQGSIVRLMACDDPAYQPPQTSYAKYNVVRLPNRKPTNADDSPPTNKGYYVKQWLDGVSADGGELPHPNDVIALVDPDQVFIGHLDTSTVRSGHAIAAAAYNLDTTFFDAVKQHCDGACENLVTGRPALMYASPYVVNAGDLKDMAALWTQLTEEFQQNESLKNRFGSVSASYAYIVAALRHRIRHDRLDLMVSNANALAEPWHMARWFAPVKPPLSFVHVRGTYQVGQLEWNQADHADLDVRRCDYEVLLEPRKEDFDQVRKLQGTPLHHSDDNAELLAKARSAFLFEKVVFATNRALRGYYEEFCADEASLQKKSPEVT